MSNLIGKAYNPYGMASNGNGLISGYEYGRNLAKQRGLASGFSKVLAGDKSGWQEMANADPVTTMDAWNKQQTLKQRNNQNTFGVGTAKGEYAQLLALRNDPKTPPEMLPSIDRRMNVLEKDPNIVLQDAINRSLGTKQGNYYGDQWTRGQKGWTSVNGQDKVLKGSEAEREWLKDNNKVLTNNDMAIRAGKTVLADIEALERMHQKDPQSISGFSASMTNFIPGTVAADAKARADSIRGNIAVDNLLNIKQSGAGLGQVPQSQAEMLSGLFGSLSQTQNDAEFMNTLNRIKGIYSDIIKSAESENRGVYDKVYDPKAQKEPTEEEIRAEILRRKGNG